MKNLNACTSDETLNFIQLYFATVDLLTEALEKYRRLSVESTTTNKRSHYRALALESERNLELLKNQRRAFLDNDLVIRPPSSETVSKVKQMAAELAKIIAKDAKANEIIDLATKGLSAFNEVINAA
ncbi:hypothetical protein [Metapseudomonas otitidis]|uniref:hypothetical protein n=1 Tax=Metapseudomonas otitidis TaxID=319939 RepID=UPI00366FF865